MAITDRSKDIAFKIHNRQPSKTLDDVEGAELVHEEAEMQKIQARIHYENAYHQLTRAIIQGIEEYTHYLDEFKKASDAYYHLSYPMSHKPHQKKICQQQ